MKITEPTLKIDYERLTGNINRMSNKARLSGVRFRPHFKTHQSVTTGEYFRDLGVREITVSSLNMAVYFADAGWNDITVAFPVNILETDKIKYLSEKIKINLLFESAETVDTVSRSISGKIGGYIKIDTGYGRTGIKSGNIKDIEKVVYEIKKSRRIQFKGFLVHSGHTYSAKSIEEIILIYEDTVSKLTELRNYFWSDDIELSIGDTPSCSVVNRFDGVDEIRPGNFVFYDYKMLTLGVCKESDIAVSVAVPVVSVHKERNNAVVYGGAVHLSKDSVICKGKNIYGMAVEFRNQGWGEIIPDNYVESLSQEHGILKLKNAFLETLKPGSLVSIVPVHSCLTVDLFGRKRV